MGKEIGFYIHIISFTSAIILFIAIILFKLKELKTNLSYLKAIIAYWLIATVIISCGIIIYSVLWIILQEGLDNINRTFGYDFITVIIISIMEASLPGLLISLITIKKSGYVNNFNRIFLSAIILVIILDTITLITTNDIIQTNFVFYTIFTDFIGCVLLGILLSLIITKLNMTIFKEAEIDKINIKYYSLIAITLSVCLSLIIYLFFINQFPSKIFIKLIDWRIITVSSYNEKEIITYEVIKPDIKSDLSKYRSHKIIFLHIHGPIGNMNVNSINYELNQNDSIIISLARLNIDQNKKNELVIDAISRSVNFKGQKIPMTIWSSVSLNQKTTIIAGIFLLISSIIASITAIFVKK